MKKQCAAIAFSLCLPALAAFAQDAGLKVSFDGTGGVLPTELSVKLRSASSAELAQMARDSSDPTERLAALWRLAGKDDKDAYVDVIAASLAGPKKDADAAVRGAAAVVLANIKDDQKTAAREALARALVAEKDPVAQISLLYAVARTKDSRYINDLVVTLVDAKAPVKIRAGAAIALRECDQKTKASVPYLIRVYSETAPKVSVDNEVLMTSAGYALRRLASTRGAPWMTPGQTIIDQIHERHPNLQMLEILFGYIAGKYL